MISGPRGRHGRPFRGTNARRRRGREGDQLVARRGRDARRLPGGEAAGARRRPGSILPRRRPPSSGTNARVHDSNCKACRTHRPAPSAPTGGQYVACPADEPGSSRRSGPAGVPWNNPALSPALSGAACAAEPVIGPTPHRSEGGTIPPSMGRVGRPAPGAPADAAFLGSSGLSPGVCAAFASGHTGASHGTLGRSVRRGAGKRSSYCHAPGRPRPSKETWSRPARGASADALSADRQAERSPAGPSPAHQRRTNVGP